MGAVFGIIFLCIGIGAYALTGYYAGKSFKESMESKNLHIKLAAGLVALWSLIKVVECFIALFAKKGDGLLGVPFIGETINALDILTWWFFAYLYGAVYLGNEKQRMWNIVHYAYIGITLVWEYIFVLFIIKGGTVSKAGVWVTFVLACIAWIAVCGFLFALKSRVPIGEFLTSRRWTTLFLCLIVYIGLTTALVIEVMIDLKFLLGFFYALEWLISVLCVCGFFMISLTGFAKDSCPIK